MLKSLKKNKKDLIKVSFDIKKINKDIFAIVVPDKYDRAMLFCRVQEFYENPSPKIKNKSFSIWEFYKSYSKKFGSFTYTKDWTGYNLPISVAKRCYELNKIETPYDEIMYNIIKKISNKNSYIIGVESVKSLVFDHELCHALYYTNYDYKKQMDVITKSIPKPTYIKIKNNLLSLGYAVSVLDDEIQAYFATEKNPIISKGIKNQSLHKKYNRIFKLSKRL